MTSSPGSSRPSIAEIIPSVAPLTTVIWVSGSMIQPGWKRAVLAAIASRSGFAPNVIAYWLWSALTASATAAFSSGGQAKSGKPWARLTAPAATASRFISRMTDSVNYSALRLIRSMRRSVGGSRGYDRRTMPTARTLDPASVLASLAVVAIVLAIHLPLARAALADLARRDDRELRIYPRRGWSIVIGIVLIVGPALYLQLGRDA